MFSELIKSRPGMIILLLAASMICSAVALDLSSLGAHHFSKAIMETKHHEDPFMGCMHLGVNLLHMLDQPDVSPYSPGVVGVVHAFMVELSQPGAIQTSTMRPQFIKRLTDVLDHCRQQLEAFEEHFPSTVEPESFVEEHEQEVDELAPVEYDHQTQIDHSSIDDDSSFADVHQTSHSVDDLIQNYENMEYSADPREPFGGVPLPGMTNPLTEAAQWIDEHGEQVEKLGAGMQEGAQLLEGDSQIVDQVSDSIESHAKHQLAEQIGLTPEVQE